MAVTSVVMAAIIGFFSAWATGNMGVSGYAFLLAFTGGSYYLYNKNCPSEAIGSGLYITALLMVLTPILFYLPNLISEPETVKSTGRFIGSFLGIFLWGFVFLVFGIVTAAVGYFFKKRVRG